MKLLPVSVALFAVAFGLRAETAQERLGYATDIFNEIMATPDKGIPQDLLDDAYCVVIVPGLKQAAFGIGGKYGRGFAICRRDGTWGAPGAVRVEGGSVGFQIGASSTDVVMLVMSERGAKRLMESKFTLGGEASAAAGPVGRSTQALTDAQLSAEILSWSRSKGLFAGIALTGATMRNDVDENKELYGQALENKDILMTNRAAPAAAKPLIAALTKYSPHQEKNRPIESQAADEVKKATGADRTDDAEQKGREMKRDVETRTPDKD